MLLFRFLTIKSLRRISGSTCCGYQLTSTKVKIISFLPRLCLFCAAFFNFTGNLTLRVIVHGRKQIYHTPWHFKIIYPYFWQVISNLPANSIKQVQRSFWPLAELWESFKDNLWRLSVAQDIGPIDDKCHNSAAVEPSPKLLHLIFDLYMSGVSPVLQNQTHSHDCALHKFLHKKGSPIIISYSKYVLKTDSTTLSYRSDLPSSLDFQMRWWMSRVLPMNPL